MRGTTAAVLLLLAAPASFAFEGKEHREVSNAALAKVEGRAPDGMKRVVETLLLGGKTFGDITQIVDWFQFPARFAVTGDWKTIDERTNRFVKRGLALHRNSSHFQLSAAEHYRDLHRAAIEAAAEQRTAEAMWDEALALHYMQDFFAPGHVVTPRQGSHDTVSGALHDEFNHKSMTVEFDLPAMSEMAKRVEMPWTVSETAFKGDGEMTETQRDFLIVVSARSIEDLFDAYRRHEAVQPTFALCFWPRSAQPVDGGRRSVDPKTFEPPFAALTYAKQTAGAQHCKCEENRVARYELKEITSKDDPTTYSLAGRAFKLGAYGVPARGGGRIVTDFGIHTAAWDPPGSIRRRVSDDDCSRCTFENTLSGSSLVTVTGIVGDRYRAAGLAIESDLSFDEPAIHTPQWTQDLYLSLDWSRRRYWHDGRHNSVVDVGVKLSYGLQVFNIVGMAERAHAVSADGDFHHQFFYMAGVEIVVTRSWFGLLRRAAFGHSD